MTMLMLVVMVKGATESVAGAGGSGDGGGIIGRNGGGSASGGDGDGAAGDDACGGICDDPSPRPQAARNLCEMATVSRPNARAGPARPGPRSPI